MINGLIAIAPPTIASIPTDACSIHATLCQGFMAAALPRPNFNSARKFASAAPPPSRYRRSGGTVPAARASSSSFALGSSRGGELLFLLKSRFAHPRFARFPRSNLSTARNSCCGTSTLPTWRTCLPKAGALLALLLLLQQFALPRDVAAVALGGHVSRCAGSRCARLA